MRKPDDPKYAVEVRTKLGRLRGFEQRNIYQFLGVQYGTARRWEQPVMVKPWNGVVNCMTLGDICPRFTGYKTLDDNFQPRPFVNASENCLNLNIFTPTLNENAKKPVVFYCHGGGFSDGAAMAQWSYDQEATARFGDVVAVSLNHRLNIFGYLDCSEFGDQYQNSGNCGQADIVLALQWVHDHISAFGGDPENVTIYGQSGGGAKVTALMQTPAADHLYQRVLAMSGIIKDNPNDQDSMYSRKIIQAMLREAGTNDFSLLRDMAPDDLMELAQRAVKNSDEKLNLRDWKPLKNDWYLGDARHAGFTDYAKQVPVIAGSCICEFDAAYKGDKRDSLTEEERLAIVRRNCKSDTAEPLINTWNRTWPGKNVLGSLSFPGMRAGTLEFANRRVIDQCTAPTWVYEFAYRFHTQDGRLAWHSSDIPLLFHNVYLYPNLQDGDSVTKLEQQMSESLYAFARNGDPNNSFLGEKWIPYTGRNQATMIFDERCTVKSDFDQELLLRMADAGIKKAF